MSAPLRPTPGPRPRTATDDSDAFGEAKKRILWRLAEPAAVMVVADDMEKAVILRTGKDGRTIQTAVVTRGVARALTLRDWVACVRTGRIASYAITAAGRAELSRMTTPTAGFAEARTPFEGRARVDDHDAAGTGRQGRLRCSTTETPVQVLARRRDAAGRRFLEPDLVEAAERLREDFESAQVGPRVTQDWERFLTGGNGGAMASGAGRSEGPRAARDRVAIALRELGPGLGDAALRCCCYLEGMETVEQRLGWPARSGKIVLQIALTRLRRHYDDVYGRSGPLIG